MLPGIADRILEEKDTRKKHVTGVGTKEIICIKTSTRLSIQDHKIWQSQEINLST
jgi:hypothetical protein